MAPPTCQFHEISSSDPDLPYNPLNANNTQATERNAPISFEDLGIPRIVSVRPTFFGNIRTSQNLGTLDWFLLIGGILSVIITLGLAIDRFIFLQPKSPDYMFALLLLYNGVFSALYVINTVFKEQAYEALAYALTSFVVLVYIAINYAHNGDDPDRYIFQLVRLLLSLFLGGLMGIVAVVVAVQQLRSQNLIFRTVGADSNIQGMCKRLFTTITLIHFDVQLLGSFIILSMEHGIATLSLEEILFISIGIPWAFAWSTLAYFAVRFESNYFFSLSMTLSPGHFAYIIYSIVMTALKGETTVGSCCKYATGSLAIIIHALVLINLVICRRNFGRGLKEKVFPTIATRQNVLR